MPNPILQSLAGAALAFGSVFLMSAHADDTGSAATDADLEQSEGMIKLKAMSDYLKSAKNLGFVVNSFFEERRESGLEIKRFVSHQVFLQHPDKLVFKAEFDDGTLRVGSFDGTKLIIALPSEKSFTEVPVSGSIDEMIDILHDKYDISLPITDFLFSDFYAAQKDYIEYAEYVGSRKLFDQTYDQVVFSGPTANWQLWIGADKPLPARFIAKYFRESGDPEYMATFMNWRIGDVTDAELSLEIPGDWKQVDLPAPE